MPRSILHVTILQSWVFIMPYALRSTNWLRSTRSKLIIIFYTMAQESSSGPISLRIVSFILYEEIYKIAHLNWQQKVKTNFGESTYPIQFFQPILTPRTTFNSWTRSNKNIFFAKRTFSFFSLFALFLNWTQSEFGC